VSGYMNYQIAKAELSATNELILYELNTSSRGVVARCNRKSTSK
jgi:hypothetical protein